jgi:hypothetical protein
VKRKRPGVLRLSGALVVAVFAAIQRHVGIAVLVAAFLGGAGLGSYLTLQHVHVQCASLIKIDPMGLPL